MKRDMDNLDLRSAFAPMPAETRNALMNAARSVKEEEPVKKAAFRTVLIAACVIVATMAVAMAAGQIFGWNDFFKNDYSGELINIFINFKLSNNLMEHLFEEYEQKQNILNKNN